MSADLGDLVNHRRSVIRDRSLAIMVAGMLGLVLVGCASVSPRPDGPPTWHGEALEAAPISIETMEWLDELQTSLDSDARLGAVAIDESRSTVTVTWHGEPSTALQELVARAPTDLEIVLQAATFRPGDLQKLVLLAMKPDVVPGVEIATGNVRNDGSGLEFGIVKLPHGLNEEDVAASIAEALQHTDLPITVTVFGLVIANSGMSRVVGPGVQS